MLDLEKYICKIVNENNKVIGTGFFVLPDGYLVTCHHVIKGLKGNVKIGIYSESEPIKGDIVRDYETEDISVIKINREKCPFLLLSTESESGEYIFSHGFSIDNYLKDFPKGFPVKSILTLHTTLENGLKMFVLDETKVNSGLSGAPAVNDKGDVIGIIRMEYNDKALVIPIEYLFGKWSDLETIHKKLLQDKYQIKPEIDIPTIQSVLRKGKPSEGDFFKPEPEWVDYEQGFIVERKEVDEIINRLVKDKIQLVLGAPASGKSIILKNVGYKLANYGKKVYIVELKKHPEDEIKLFIENIPKKDVDNSIFIIDDAHLYLSYCDKLATDFDRRGEGNLIIGSRKTEEITKEHPIEGAEYKKLFELSKTHNFINAENITEKMITTFLNRKHQFDDIKIKKISNNLGQFKKDLWQLSWALIAYDPRKDFVDIHEIYKKIRYKIKEIKIGKDEKEKPIIINAEDMFLPLSIFYRYEIPIERYFLENQMGVEGNIIKQLIGFQEIVETEKIGEHKMLSLNHSSIAKLYFGAYQNFPDLGRRTKEIILNGKDDENLEFCSFYRYMTTTDPRNSIDVIMSLGRCSADDEKGEKTLLKNLIEEEKIQKSIIKGINKEEDIRKVGSCVSDIARENEEVAMKLVDSVSAKINTEEDIENVGSCVSNISYNRPRKKLVDSIDIHALAFKIDKEQDIGKVGNCVSAIAGRNKEIATNLVDSIDIYALSSKIDKEQNIRKVQNCVRDITSANKEAATRLVNSIDIHALASQIDKEQDIGKVSNLLSAMKWGYNGNATKLVDSIDIYALSLRIEAEQDIEKVGWCVKTITEASEEAAMKLVDSVSKIINKEEDIGNIGSIISSITKHVSFLPMKDNKAAMKLIDRIDIHALASKIEKEYDIKKVKDCVSAIANGNEEVATKLVDRMDIHTLASKIDIEQDIKKVKECLVFIESANKNVAKKLVDSIDIHALASKIEEQDIGSISWWIYWISDRAQANKKVVTKLVDNIDIHALASEIDREQDIQEVVSFVSNIAQASEKVALKLVDSVSAKIYKERDIVLVESYVYSIALVSKEVGIKLANSIDINALSTKIDKEGDIKLVGSYVYTIAFVSKEVGIKLANSIDLITLSSKINKEENIKKVTSCIANIALASKKAAMKLANSIDINALSTKINREEDMGKAGWYVSVIAQTSKKVALRLLDNVSIRINNEEDIEKVGTCVLGIVEANKEIALKLANSIDINALSSKINNEEDIEKVGWCVSAIAHASKNMAWKMPESIDLTAFSTKINDEEDIEKVARCIARISIEVVKKIINRLNPKLREELQKRISKL
jgi:hypothetical protein